MWFDGGEMTISNANATASGLSLDLLTRLSTTWNAKQREDENSACIGDIATWEEQKRHVEENFHGWDVLRAGANEAM